MQAVTDLLKSLLKQNKPSHTSFNKSTHKHLLHKQNIQITSHHTNIQTRDITNQTIGDTTTKANIGITPK